MKPLAAGENPGLPRAARDAARQSGLNNGKRSISSGCSQNSKRCQSNNTTSTPHSPRHTRSKGQRCPECGSQRLWKDGLRYTGLGEVQRWLCRDCGFRFSQSTAGPNVKVHVAGKLVEVSNPAGDHVKSPVLRSGVSLEKTLDQASLFVREDVGSHVLSHDGSMQEGLNALRSYNSKRRVCVSEDEAKNLVEAAEKTKLASGIHPPTQPADVKGKLVEYLFYMQKQGYAPETIRGNVGALRALLARNADLFNPESVKEVLAKEQKWGANRRRNIINAYGLFLKMNGLTWEKPRCNVVRKIPFIPTEQEIDELIAGCPNTVATFLQLLKETGMRSGEAKRLKWIDVDFHRRTITLNEPEKNSLPRVWGNLSSKLLGMLNALPRRSQLIFGDATLNSLKATFSRARRRLAYKLQNPRLMQIHFHTLRHWKATMEYHRTKDLLRVMQLLGHKKSDNTLLYVQLDQELFKDLPDDMFICKVANNIEDAKALVEVGFEYVAGDFNSGGMIFRKRK